MTKTSELAHLFRALKAPAAARALPKLAERAREEEWSYERFAEALLSTEVASRESHGGESRIKAARFPARKTLEEFDFTFQRSVKRTVVEHLGQLDFLAGTENVVMLGPRDRQDAPGDRARDPGVPGRPARCVHDRDRVGGAPRRRQAGRQPRGRAQTPRLRPARRGRRSRILMPSRELCGVVVGIPVWRRGSAGGARHNQSASRNASRVSGGR